MKIKRLLAVAFVSALLLSGCVSPTQPDESDGSESIGESVSESDDTVTETEPQTEYISLVKEGKAQFTIISEGSEFHTLADRLQTTLLNKTATTFTVRRFNPDGQVSGKIYVGCSVWVKFTQTCDKKV